MAYDDYGRDRDREMERDRGERDDWRGGRDEYRGRGDDEHVDERGGMYLDRPRGMDRERDRDWQGRSGRDLDDRDDDRGGPRGDSFGGGRGFDGGTGYGGAGNSSAYRGESSWGGQAGYGGSRAYGAYSGGSYGREQGDSRGDTWGGEQLEPDRARSGRGRGTHAGRGPKGYRRSDERITEDVCEALTRDPDVDASEIEVKVQDGEVTLTGTVDSRQAKRRAEDVVERCAGVRDVLNQVRVSRSDHEVAKGATSERGATGGGGARKSRSQGGEEAEAR